MLSHSKLFIAIGALVLLILSAIACANTPPLATPVPAPLQPQVVPTRTGMQARWLMNWDNPSRKTWYLTPQGSLVMPMDVFMTLRTADGSQLFSAWANLQQYGWVYPPESDNGAFTLNGLPLGFVQEPNPAMRNVETFGLTCAACHTGELVVNNTRYVVDGGQPMSDIQEWDIDMAAALGAALNDTERLTEMQGGIAARNPQSSYATNLDLLKADMTTVYDYLNGRAERNTAAVDYGWGRLDAFTQIFNEILVSDAGMDAKDAQGKLLNVQAPASPISYPYLWTVPNLECVQTNCIAQDPMVRNLGETIGVYGHIDLRVLPNSVSPTLDLNDVEALAKLPELLNVTANPNKLYDLEHPLATLPVPQWQSEFGALNPDLVKRGAEIFNAAAYNVDGAMQSCATCHVVADANNPASMTAPNSVGHQFFKVSRWAPNITGTDTAFLDNQTYRPITDLPPVINGIYDALVFENQPLLQRFTNKDKKYAIDFLGLTTGLAMKKWYAVNRITPAEQSQYMEYHALTSPDDLYKYKARPLNGIAFTAPYLHNGSVPTLAELLKKPADRAKTFALGSLSWDTSAVGYKHSDNETFDYPKFTFDTSILGNKNTGHEWGTELSDADKQALIEYLKSQ